MIITSKEIAQNREQRKDARTFGVKEPFHVITVKDSLRHLAERKQKEEEQAAIEQEGGQLPLTEVENPVTENPVTEHSQENTYQKNTVTKAKKA